jgi:ABC-2 type transport system permease protein
MEKIVLWLPFPYLIYFPMRIYLGKIPPAQLMLDLLREGIWIAGLSFLNWAVWKKGVRQYVAMGD